MVNPIILLFLFLFGIALGSFFNVVVSRLGKTSAILAGRSGCDHCKRPLRWFELIPLLSFAIQSGRCRSCRGTIPLRYPLLELFCGMAAVSIGLAVLSGSITLPFAVKPASLAIEIVTWLYYLFFASLALAIAVYDYERFLVPRALIGPLAAVGFLVQFLIAWNIGTFRGFWLTLAAAVIAYLFFAAISVLSKGRAMGLGDAELASVLAFYLPPEGVALAIMLAFFSGALLGGWLVLVRKLDWSSRIAFTPFLVWGAIISLLFGNGIIGWYLRFLG